MAEEKTKVPFGEKVKKFFRDYKSEFKKISWPSKEDTTKKTIMVLVAIAIIGVSIFLVDTGLSKLIELLAKIR
ncbi:MAG: preprotein translocase subunit SecE [Clostridia bacterium]|nr:preprotein translocase subunit SecE [Clostridia bacterium]